MEMHIRVMAPNGQQAKSITEIRQGKYSGKYKKIGGIIAGGNAEGPYCTTEVVHVASGINASNIYKGWGGILVSFMATLAIMAKSLYYYYGNGYEINEYRRQITWQIK